MDVEYTDEFEEWWLGLTRDQQETLEDRVTLLAEVDLASSAPSWVTSRPHDIPT